jgi:hypothetical protein
MSTNCLSNVKKRVIKLIPGLSIVFVFIAWLKPEEGLRILMAGDSTMSIKETSAFPETGWGMPFVYFWDKRVTVINKSKNGRSTQSFKEEGLWKELMDASKPGDYVFIQFGHNDEVPTKKTYTTEVEFVNNLENYVKEAREKQLHPLLLTPMARRKFDVNGKIEGTHDVYSELVRKTAIKMEVPLLDMDLITQGLYQEFGVENSKLLFLQVKPGEHPNYPQGKEDNTHFNELGARMVAQLVLRELKETAPELMQFLAKKS